MSTVQVLLYFGLPIVIWLFIAALVRRAFERKQQNPQFGFIFAILVGLFPIIFLIVSQGISDVATYVGGAALGLVLELVFLLYSRSRYLPKGFWLPPEEDTYGAGKEDVDGIEISLHVLLLLLGLVISSPIWIAIFSSFKLPEDMITYPPTLLPDVWTFENYVTAWTTQPLFRYFINSVIQTGIIVLAQVVFSILAAYAFAILDFPGRNFVFYLILASLMVPFQLTFIPNFVLVSNWGLANSYAGLTIPFLASAFGVFMLRQFFLTLPRELYDAAKVDGASSWRYLWQIVVPLSKGAVSAFATFAFLSAWSQYLWPLVITNDTEMRTIQIGIRFFLFDQERGADWGAIMAGAVIALLPTLVLFLVAQRQLVRGIATTGLKG